MNYPPTPKPYIPTADAYIHATPLLKNTKVFTAWNSVGYMSGKKGDYLALRSDNPTGVHIIAEDIFYKTYDRLS